MKILAIALNDLTRSLRSAFLVGMAVAAPLLVTGLIYFAFGSMTGGDVSLTPVQVGVVNLDELPAGALLDEPLGETIRAMFYDESVKSWIAAADFADEESARAALEAQQIGAAVIVPAGFTRAYLEGGQPQAVTILQDPTLKIGPGVVRDMVSSLMDGVAGGGVAYQVAGKNLGPEETASLMESYSNWYAGFQRDLFHNPDRAALVVTSPGAEEKGGGLQATMGLVLAGQLVFFSFFSGAYAMMSILQEAEEGTLARMFSTPTRRTAILAGKFLAVFLTVLLQGCVLLTAGWALFGVRWGQPGAVSLALLGQMLASVGLAVLLVSFIQTSKQAGPIFGGALTGLGMLSGLFTTNIAMPESFNAIASFTPQGWVLKAWRLALGGQPAAELLLPFLVLVGMGVVMFAAGALKFRRRFA